MRVELFFAFQIGINQAWGKFSTFVLLIMMQNDNVLQKFTAIVAQEQKSISVLKRYNHLKFGTPSFF